jgi:hypothetical protein
LEWDWSVKASRLMNYSSVSGKTMPNSLPILLGRYSVLLVR